MNPDFIEELFSFPYKCDDFQIKSAKAIIEGKNTLSLGHTGSGKTSIGIIGVANALKQNKKAIFTTPIKCLSNQKYGDFQKDFPNNSVGILTGDIKINPDADVIVATQEIIANMLFQNKEFFDDVGVIVIDETHYINSDRGGVYEQTISMMPVHVTFVLLSATISKPEILKNWMEKTRGIECVLSSTDYRPIPLQQNVYVDGLLKNIIKDGDFNDSLYKTLFNNWKGQDKKISQSTRLKNFVGMLEEKDLFPALFFVFSRKNCEKFADMFERSLITGKEQTECLKLYDFYIKKMLGEDGMQISQYWRIRKFLSKGVCIHHSGLVPVIKEIIEILFEKKYIKLMFVTETFSVGINMPTRTVVFTELEKFDGKEKRVLLPSEYIQMAGRAGRRGKDTVGHVIYFQITHKPMILLSEFAEMVSGKHANIKSKFEINPNFILKCIDNDINIKEELGKTMLFNEISSQKKGITYEIEELDKKIESITIENENKIIELKKLENKKLICKPKQKQQINVQINEAKKVVDQKDIEQFENRSKLIQDLKKLNCDLIHNDEYIDNTINNIKDVLIDTGYMQNSGTITIQGRSAASFQEVESFLAVEYIHSLLQSIDFYSIEDYKYIIPFIIGTLVDDRDLNREDLTEDTFEMLNNVFNEKNQIENVKYELKTLKKFHEQLLSEGRLKEPENKLTPMFGIVLYLWVNGKSFNEIKEFVPEIYEGNFCKNILKCHNICEEIINMFDIYSVKSELKKILTEIQSKLIKDIVIIDSLYIK
jgi:superfamily II RNA helicase